jgi:hypothetical protein
LSPILHELRTGSRNPDREGSAPYQTKGIKICA